VILHRPLEMAHLREGVYTFCRKDLFFSYRRDGRRSGRMLNFITAAEKG